MKEHMLEILLHVFYNPTDPGRAVAWSIPQTGGPKASGSSATVEEAIAAAKAYAAEVSAREAAAFQEKADAWSAAAKYCSN